MSEKKLQKDFYERPDVVGIAKDLLGKVLFSNIDGETTAGIITETEAYSGMTDKACHAYGGRRTKRTEVMYHQGGTAYVYLCYGIHHLFNVVTNKKGHPDAVLVRAIHPFKGKNTILERRNADRMKKGMTNGPGKVTEALGIKTKEHSGLTLFDAPIWIEDRGIQFPDDLILIGPRIGIDYAEEDADLPYRFRIEEEKVRTYL